MHDRSMNDRSMNLNGSKGDRVIEKPCAKEFSNDD